MPNARARRADGFSQVDYALRNASWHVTNVLRGLRRESDDRKEGFFDTFTAHEDGWPERYPFESPDDATRNIRRAAKPIGVGLFGVKEFCDICQRCSQACPPKAIPSGEPIAKAHSISNFRGIRKWTTVAEKCFRFWAGQNSDCSICIRVCPYNRDFSKWYNRLWQRLAGTRLRRLMLAADKLFYERKRTPSSAWWKS